MRYSYPISGPLGLGDLLDGAFRVYRANFVPLLLTAAIFLAPVGVISLVLIGAASSNFLELFIVGLDRPLSDGELFQPAGLLGSVLLVSLLGYAAGALTFLSLTVQGDAFLAGAELPLRQVVGRALGRLLPFVGMAIAAGIAMTGLVLLAYVGGGMGMAILGILGFLAFDVIGNELVAALVFIVTMLFTLGVFVVAMAPLLVLTARWIAAPTLVVNERLGPIAALGRSWRLTRGYFWRAIGYIVLLTLLNTVVFGLPLTLVQAMAAVLMTSQLAGWLSGAMMGVSYFFSILWYPFLALTMLLIYYDLRMRNENLDLELRIRTLEESLPPAPLPE